MNPPKSLELLYLFISLWLMGAVTSEGVPTVARKWNEANLAAIRIDRPNPPVHARNLFHVAVAMYDAWAAYDQTAIGYIHHERAMAVDVNAAREEAISFAAYRMLKARYINSVSKVQISADLDAQLLALGYDKTVTSAVGSAPANVGNRIASVILTWGLGDGSNEAGGYMDGTYSNSQPAFPVLENGVPLSSYPAGSDPDRWHPLTFDEGLSQNGVDPITLQKFVGVSWLQTRPFTLSRTLPGVPWIDPGGPARLRAGGGANADAAGYRAAALGVLQKSAELGELSLIDISPMALGNNPLGTEAGMGRTVNPVTAQPYASQWVPRGDYARVIAEYWADGPDSETPPGHWHAIANQVSDALPLKRIRGTGAVVSDLEWDVKLYFALAGATHDAACAAWSLKRRYDSPRPISTIRFLARQGQCSDPGLPSYHVEGMPLVAGLTAVVTNTSLALGGQHHGMPLSGAPFQVGEIVVRTWPGRPEDPTVQRGLPTWIRGTSWFPYQDRTFVTPAFPGYISGHSTFSRAAAEVLASMTGSDYFPGGLATFTAPAGTFLKTEFGPSVSVQLQWATYFDAADEAGSSRRWGGIHPAMDDLPGRIIGAQCGQQAMASASEYWDASVLSHAFQPTIKVTALNVIQLEWESVRGLWYRVESSTDLSLWTPIAGPTQATDVRSQWTDTAASQSRKFYRIVNAAAP
jgi:hypothetical protein